MLKNKIVKNIGWLVVDKFLILFLQFFIGVKIANYYGSQVYGEYSYAMAIVGFSPIVLEIINRRVVKEFYEEDFNKTVSSVTTFRNILSLILFLGAILSYPLFQDNISLYLMIILLCFDSFLLTTTAGIESYFEYRLLSKNIVISNNIVKIISYLLQYIGLILKCSILMIPIIRVLGSLLRMIILKRFYYKSFKEKVKITLDKSLILKLVDLSKYLWLSVISYIIASQIDKIMLGNMLGVKEVGIYSIAVQLTSVLAIVIGPFQTSLYPKLLELFRGNKDEYSKAYKKYTSAITYLYLFGVISSIFVIKILFNKIYSIEYSEAISLYMILSIGIFFKANAFLRSTHITLIKNTRIILMSELIAMIFNVILNYLLIEKIGVKGAAIATSITQMISLWGVDLFSSEGRKILKYQISGFNIKNLFN
ncbi:MAG: flippase [Cetobacterium sp.]